MEEEKKNQQNQGGQGGGQGGRKRRHKHKHKPQGENRENGQQKANVGGNKPQPQAPSQPQKQNQSQKQNQAQQQNKKQQKTQQPQAQPQPQKLKQFKPQPQSNQANGEQGKQNKKQDNQNRKDTYLYTLDGNLYVNLTNKCSNACEFCVRNERTSYYGNYLWLNHGDPTAEKVISVANGMGDLSRFKEAVFCGFGEPTYKVEEMLALCDYFHSKGLKTRLNTNGQGNLINKRDIIPELKGKLDKISISLNASSAEKYKKICRSQYGENGFTAMVDFAKQCKRSGLDVAFSVVDSIGEEEIELCKYLAASVSVPLKIRKYIADAE